MGDNVRRFAGARSPQRFNPIGNERLTAAVGVVLLILTVVELATIPLGVHRFMSLHVFVGFVLIPPVLLKLASTGWRFARYYTRNQTYMLRGPPQVGMRLLAPLIVAATIVLFGSGVAMGIVHGHVLTVARRLHGPVSVAWIVLVGVHVLVYLKRALVSSVEDVAPSSRAAVPGASVRAYVLTTAVVSGIAIGAATVPAQHHWVNLPRNHRRHDRNATAPASDGMRVLAMSGASRAALDVPTKETRQPAALAIEGPSGSRDAAWVSARPA